MRIIILILILVSCSRNLDPFPDEEIQCDYPKLTDIENHKMSRLINNIPVKIRISFNYNYHNWKNTWDWDQFKMCSNPRCWTKSDEYLYLLNYCKRIGNKIWPLVFNKYLEEDLVGSRDYLVALVVEDLTWNDFGYLIESVRAEIKQNNTRIWEDAWIYYIQHVLAYYNVESGEIISK